MLISALIATASVVLKHDMILRDIHELKPTAIRVMLR